jgi:hypothetical protein
MMENRHPVKKVMPIRFDSLLQYGFSDQWRALL